MPRPSASEYGSFYQTYINNTTGNDYAALVQQYNHAIIAIWSSIPLHKIDYAYASGKWTIKQMLQHVIDTERIFAYRALAIARKENNSSDAELYKRKYDEACFLKGTMHQKEHAFGAEAFVRKFGKNLF